MPRQRPRTLAERFLHHSQRLNNAFDAIEAAKKAGLPLTHEMRHERRLAQAQFERTVLEMQRSEDPEARALMAQRAENFSRALAGERRMRSLDVVLDLEDEPMPQPGRTLRLVKDAD